MKPPAPPVLVLLAAIAAVEGVALIGYGLYDVAQGLTVGLTGPAEVSNLPGLLLQIVIFLILGGAGVWIAVGWWRVKYAARAPFILGQILALVVGFPMAQAYESGQRGVGLALVVTAVVGIAAALLPSVTRALVRQSSGS